jgi:uracil-DNA glycosylase
MQGTQTDQASLRKALCQRLESLHRAGITHLPRPRAAASFEQPAITPVPAPHIATRSPSAVAAPPLPITPRTAAPLFSIDDDGPAPLGPALPTAEKTAALTVLQKEVAGCTRCHELATTRTHTVFGVGSPNARLLFLGEAPGADEDRLGEPFVGRAGQLLTDMITKGMRLRREDVYIMNVLKCRPPANRNPSPNEVINCRGFLDRQIETIHPDFICCLGSIAAKALLNSDLSIGRLRGKWHNYRGIPVVCTYHPAYLLRNPAAKRDVWEDLKLLMDRMGLAYDKK